MRTLDAAGSQAIGHDVKHSAFTHRVGSVAGRDFVKKCMLGYMRCCTQQRCTSPTLTRTRVRTS